jgi:HEAT repeat protein
MSAVTGLLQADPADATLVLMLGASALMIVLVLVFAALTLVMRLRHSRTAARLWRLERRWTGPLMDALADPQRIQALRKRVESSEESFLLRFLLRHYRQLSGAERATVCEIARPFLPRVERGLQGQDPENRAVAIQILGSLGLPRHQEVVLRALEDPSPLVAMVAARALARTGDPGHAEVVLASLNRFHRSSRAYLASMLAAVGPSVAPALRRTLVDHRLDPWVRAVSADALTELNDLESADLAAAAVAQTNDRELLASTLRLLGRVGSDEHLPAVEAHATSDDFVIRACAMSALGELGREEVTPRLIGALARREL